MSSGAYLPLEDGADLRLSLVLEDSAGDPIDVTGGTVDAVDSEGEATDAVTVTVTDATGGAATVSRDWTAGDVRIVFHIRYTEPGGHAFVWPPVTVVYN